MALARLCALLLACFGCGSNPDWDTPSTAGTAGGGDATQPSAGRAGASAAAGAMSVGGAAGSGGAVTSGSENAAAGGVAPSKPEESSPPPAVNGRSIYALECHGDSKDCQLATTPCFGIGSPTPSVAAGWACANRCSSNSDCSNAPSGGDAEASCVPFTSNSHCMLVCQREQQTFACPDGMTCYVPAKSPVGYCLWQ
jgi:hypothetical protein